MKIFVVLFVLLVSFTATAQLTYLGDDVIQRNYDGYASGKKTPGLVSLDGQYYFITPNGNFYQTDGTAANTKIAKQFSPQTVAYLKATNKYVYFAYGNGSDFMGDLARYSPASGLNIVRNPNNNNAMLSLNSQVVPGNNFLVDEVFTNYDNDAFLIRKFTSDNFYVYIINDHNDNAKVNLVFTQKLNSNYVTTPISVNTELETFKTDVYCNGRERPTGVYQTTINIIKRTESDAYEFKTNFSVLKYGLFPYDRLLRTNNNIYSLCKVVDSAVNKKYLRLYAFNDKTIVPTKTAMLLEQEDVATQTIDGEIYISYKGSLVKFDEAQEKYIDIIYEKDAAQGWQNISKNTRFLKVGDHYMYRRNGALAIYNSALKTTTAMTGAFYHANENYFTQHKVEAYAGKNSFYFTQKVNDKTAFTRYNPVTNTYTPIVFPAFKKQDFESIKAIFNHGNHFVFLTAYKGKKNKLLYKMFMYTEDGAPLLAAKQPAIKAQPKIEPVPAPKPFDIKSFDIKLFNQQIVKVINNQGNQFADIMGESIASDMAPKNKSLVKLEGFGEGIIINYKQESKLLRYQATTVTISGKAAAMAFLDLLDKEVQKIIAGNTITREIDVDVKTRKVINYIYNGDVKLLQLDLYTDSGTANPDEAGYTITIRADKKTR